MKLSSEAINRRYASLLGRRFGNLILLSISPNKGDKSRVLGACICDCGNTVDRPIGRLPSGVGCLTHCGCLTDHGAHRTHGMRYTKEYKTWAAIKVRCHAPTNKDYPNYGAKGIRVHEAWRNSFEPFYEHIGPCPSPTHTIDRIDNKKGYEPFNVRWATRSEQCRNRSVSLLWTIKGLSFETLQEAADHFKVSEHSVWRWVNGQFDPRDNSYQKPREDCNVANKY